MRSLQAIAWLSYIGVRPTSAAQLVASRNVDSPVKKVVELIENLKKTVEKDGKEEEASYEKYATWCETTLKRKASAISKAKDTITDTQDLILKLKAETATHSVEITNNEKLIKQNVAAQQKATEIRKKESAEYTVEKTESEQCLGALEAAIKTLTGAGSGKAGFLATMQEAQLLSVVAGVRGVMMHSAVADKISDSDMQVVKKFVDHPEDFVAGAAPLSALQTAQNPFGDYAPQSTQIQGILKGMYDAFSVGLEKANGEEAEQEKAFRELMGTKKEELDTLEKDLERHQGDNAEKGKTLVESRKTLDETAEQLDADKEFFTTTTDACRTKAHQWEKRKKLRTEEIEGMSKALEILTSDDAKKTLDSSATTFLQVSPVSSRAESALKRIRTIAKRSHSLSLARITADLRTGGHFDKVIAAIDKMIGTLREEEADDIEHRDRCQGSQNKNKNDKEDLEHDIESKEKELTRLGHTEKELQGEIKALEGDIKATKADMKELLNTRNKEAKDFKQALKDDADAVDVIGKAIFELEKFYNKNAALVQHKAPEYQDKGPAPTISDGNSRKGEATGVIGMLKMIKEGTEKEMMEARKDEQTALEEYEEQSAAMRKSIDKMEESKTLKERELVDVQKKIEDIKEAKKGAEEDLAGETKMEKSLKKDCAWVETHFDDRRKARKAEMDGLVDAKNFLAEGQR